MLTADSLFANQDTTQSSNHQETLDLREAWSDYRFAEDRVKWVTQIVIHINIVVTVFVRYSLNNLEEPIRFRFVDEMNDDIEDDLEYLSDDEQMLFLKKADL